MANTPLSTSSQEEELIIPGPQDYPHAAEGRFSLFRENIPSILASGDEQALESHEVIELQSFSERKAWIEEKIKFLEALPPIEVFTGLDSINSSVEQIPGLPTRTELAQWMTEHDIIEKETEIFDTGELKKLRQLTKAATQRNLSPGDTDVIELTLTTIYALDKLLHLLRDRSENLDMMSIRLSWEENRRAAWEEQRQIIEDLNIFADTRARWKPSIYEISSALEDSNGPLRRGSVASQASAASDNIISSPAFSRTTRFRLAEVLSRDAAQFSGRITSLRHGKVASAGKALDKLIDQSRKPVPDELLDEQDRLEEKCINEMENVSKFAMNLVMQWRKADEVYIETKKDYISASNLLEEIEIAKLYHPTARQSSSFGSRADTILKRLAIRGDPSSANSLFPRPEHFLFPDQKVANESLIKTLSTDIAATNKLAVAVNAAAKEYKTTYEAVRQVETLIHEIGQVSTDILAITKKFQEGIAGGDEDGSPPNLSSELCLNPERHALYIAIFPSLLDDTLNSIQVADRLLDAGPSLLLGLDDPGVDSHFKQTAITALESLSSLRSQVSVLRDSSADKLARLRDCRKIAFNIHSTSKLLRTAKIQMVDLMEHDRWRQQFGGVGAPPTPESPTSELPLSPSSYSEFGDRLAQIKSATIVDVTEPLEKLSHKLDSDLLVSLNSRATSLQLSLEDGERLFRLLGGVREQSSAMSTIRDEYYDIMGHIEDAKIQITSKLEELLGSSVEDVATKLHHPDTADIPSLEAVQNLATAFVESISRRVPFIAQHSAPTASRSSLKSPSILPGLRTQDEEIAVVPFDCATLDSLVRSDSNTYALRINGGIETLTQLKEQFDMAKLARKADVLLYPLVTDMNTIARAFSVQNSLFGNIPRRADNSSKRLQEVLVSLQAIIMQHSEISSSFPPIRILLGKMDEISKALGISIRDKIYKPRSSTFRSTESRSNMLSQGMMELHVTVEEAIRLEYLYQEEVKATRARELKEFEERQAAEEAARIQRELHRVEEEARQRLLEKQAEELQQQRLARERENAELAEKQLAERLSAEAEQRRLKEIEREAEALRLATKEEERIRNDIERAHLEQGRIDALERLRLTEAQLQEERRLHAQRELTAARLADRQRNEMEELTKRHIQMELIAKETAHLAESERTDKQLIQDQIKEHEEYLIRQNSELQQRFEDQSRLAQQERAEKERLEREAEGYVQALSEQHVKEMILAEENATRLELARMEQERAQQDAKKLIRELDDQREAQRQLSGTAKHDVAPMAPTRVKEERDVFGIINPLPAPTTSNSEDLVHLQSQVLSLRKRLRSICMKDVISPRGSAQLPTAEHFYRIRQALEAISIDIQLLPTKPENDGIKFELESLREEFDQHHSLLQDIERLADMTTAIQLCDNALSDLLEHVDSYPVAPLLTLSAHKSKAGIAPEEQLSARLGFTNNILKEMNTAFSFVKHDHRAISEQSRLTQAWAELREMATDRINGRKSRPSSVVSKNNSSGRNSSISNTGPSTQVRTKKAGSYSNLSVTSVSGASKGKMLAPPIPLKPRRAASNNGEVISRSASRSSSISTARSVSGPVKGGPSKPNEIPVRTSSRISSASTARSVSGPLNASLHGSTFASRQRTTSLSGGMSTPSQQPSLTPSRFRMNSETKRGISPAISENSSYSHSHSSMGPRSSSTWSRAPRDSLSSLLPRVTSPPRKATPPVRKKYVADPKNKLDVAVGDVVNQLEVGINIESISDSWRDQSGKYWIGNQDPKLCFCRILRSQTVMVRVGGGWSELSKFIKDHFADSFRLAPGPESPPRGAQAERWISSATLLETRESLSPPRTLRTPEPNILPSFSLITPSGGHSPKSIKSSSPSSHRGSPLMPLQFMRRAEAGPDVSLFQQSTPSKTPLRGRLSTSNTPARPSVWRP